LRSSHKLYPVVTNCCTDGRDHHADHFDYPINDNDCHITDDDNHSGWLDREDHHQSYHDYDHERWRHWYDSWVDYGEDHHQNHDDENHNNWRLHA
jgi:hypothetical protein